MKDKICPSCQRRSLDLPEWDGVHPPILCPECRAEARLWNKGKPASNAARRADVVAHIAKLRAKS